MSKNNLFSWVFVKALTLMGVTIFTIFLTFEYEKNPADILTFFLNNHINFISLLIMAILFIISEIKLQESVKKTLE